MGVLFVLILKWFPLSQGRTLLCFDYQTEWCANYGFVLENVWTGIKVNIIFNRFILVTISGI